MSSPANLTRQDGATIAYRRLTGSTPGVVFLGGFRSDMTGTKALYLADYCRRRGQAYLRFDYFGHGASSGEPALGTIGRWAEDAVAVLDSLTEGPQVLVGSSMGGWIMLLAALARPPRVHALVGIAAAPDFTEDLLWPRLDPAQQRPLRDAEFQPLIRQEGRVKIEFCIERPPDVVGAAEPVLLAVEQQVKKRDPPLA